MIAMAMRRGWRGFRACGLVLGLASVTGDIESMSVVGVARAEPAVIDAARPVAALSDHSFTLQWFTSEAVPTVVRVREGGLSYAESMGLAEPAQDPWSDLTAGGADAPAGVREVMGDGTPTRVHRIEVAGLKPGTRYFYQVGTAESERPTRQEIDFGARERTASALAGAPKMRWRREFAVSTLAGPGQRTVIRYPVKVLIMPNVVNVGSAVNAPAGGDHSHSVPPPPKADAALVAALRAEFDKAALFFWINSRMRYWVDFHLVFDERWQAWGEAPQGGEIVRSWGEEFTGMPMCRSYDGVDYQSPGGGRFTFFSLDDPERVSEKPLREKVTDVQPFAGQIEVAMPRRYDAGRKRWVFYTSGGGTLGVDAVTHGLPGRSQFFGGYDTAWLATHEFHHQMESLGSVSLSDREDERIVFNHWSPRSRDRAPDAASGPEGLKQPHPWSTSGPHGEHYDGMSYWDRTLSDAQWLRMYYGRTIVVADADDDGFPDDDPRLPLDEKRFGSDASNPMSDGRMNDLAKATLSNGAPEVLQIMFDKPAAQRFAKPKPRTADSDGDGMDDVDDPAPLVPHAPFVWPLRATIDGDAAEWTGVPLSGELRTSRSTLTYRHGFDDDAYYGVFELGGDWARVRVVLDGEGHGAYSGEGVQAFEILHGDEGVQVRPTFVGVKGFTSNVGSRDGVSVVEIRIENWAEQGWFWRGSGREVGVAIEVHEKRLAQVAGVSALGTSGGAYSVYEPYAFFRCRMLEQSGQPPMPGSPPANLGTIDGGVFVFKPGHPAVKAGSGWAGDEGGGPWRYREGGESPLWIEELAGEALALRDFDVWIKLEAKSDAILGAFVRGQNSMSAMRDYLAFVGGYSNTRSRLRLFGNETGDGQAMCSPGVHTMQLSRRDGVVWVLWDGVPIIWSKDPKPAEIVDRLAVLGGYDGAQVVHEIRVRK